MVLGVMVFACMIGNRAKKSNLLNFVWSHRIALSTPFACQYLNDWNTPTSRGCNRCVACDGNVNNLILLTMAYSRNFAIIWLSWPSIISILQASTWRAFVCLSKWQSYANARLFVEYLNSLVARIVWSESSFSSAHLSKIHLLATIKNDDKA